ncbi:MAG: hypothetical protein ACM3QS_14140 [Bacteroidota bacterium]
MIPEAAKEEAAERPAESTAEAPAVERQAQAPAPFISSPEQTHVQKGRSRTWTVLLLILVILLAAGAAALGYWGYTLNNSLLTSQQKLSQLQSQYDQLKTENEGLNTQLTDVKAQLATSQADLKSTQADLTTAQADLKKEQETSKTLQAKITKEAKLVDVAIGLIVNEENDRAIEKRVQASGDSQLISLFKKAMTTRKSADWHEWLIYLFEGMEKALK